MMAASCLVRPTNAEEPPGPEESGEQDASESVEPPPLVKTPELLEFVEAPYPEQAQADGIEATVLLLIEIDEQGAVTAVEVLRAAGHGFDEAAAEAARQLRFSPAEDESGPVPVAIEFEYGFELSEGATAPGDGGDPGAGPDAAQVNLEGVLRFQGTAGVVAGAVILATPDADPGARQETTTDEEGRFEFRGLPAGTVTIAARHPGCKDLSRELEITEGEVTSVKLWIGARVGQDTEILALYEREREPEITRRTISMKEVRTIPGTYGDPVRVIQNLPGVARSTSGRGGAGGVVIRGANPDDSRFYVDGVEVPIIYHLGNYASILGGDMVSSVDYLPGGYGVEFGRGTGGVIQVNTVDEYEDRLRVRWNADLLDTGVSLNGRIGKIGLSGSGRVSYLHAWFPALMDSFASRGGGRPDGGGGGGGVQMIMPQWWDYQFKAEVLDLPRDDLSLLVFGFGDEMSILSSQGPASLTGDDEGEMSLRYGTNQAVLRWDHHFHDTLTMRLQPTVGYQTQHLGYDVEATMEQNSLVLGGRAHLAWKPHQAFQLKGGLDMLAEESSSSVFSESGVGRFDVDPLAESEPVEEELETWVVSPDPFLDFEIRPLNKRENLVLVPGVRLDTFAVGEDFHAEAVSPRFAFRLSPLPGGTLKGGTGLYHQPPNTRFLTMASTSDGELDLDLERCWSTEIGWEQRFSNAISLDVTYFHREMDQLVVRNPDEEAEAPFANAGIGRADGMEVMLRHRPVNPFFGWISYTLSKSQRNDDPDDPDSDWYLFDYDQTHILTVLASYRLPWDMALSARFQYVSGNPYTPYTGGVYDLDMDRYSGDPSTDKNSERMSPYINLDFRVEQRFNIKRARLSIYADLLGIVQGENPDSVTYNYDYTETSYVEGLPFIPSAGFELELNF